MSDIVCVHCKNKTQGIPLESVKHPSRAEITQKICEVCWVDWKGYQIKVINEYQFKLFNPEDRKKLDQMMREYLNLDDNQSKSKNNQDYELPGEKQGGGI